MRPQTALVRFVRGTSPGAFTIGRTQPGRGAYVCADAPDCVETACKRRRLTPEQADSLRSYLAERERMEGRVFKGEP